MLFSSRDKEAVLQYMPNGFRMIKSGDHVCCAITGEKIALDELTYWSVEHQEPYANVGVSVKATLDRLGNA